MSKISLATDFRDLKFANIQYAHMLSKFELKPDPALERIATCSDYMTFAVTEDYQHMKVHHGSYCHDRWCPICASRKGYKQAMELYTLMNYADHNGYALVWLTLTVPNVPGYQLHDELRHLKKSWRRLYRLKGFFSGKAEGFWLNIETTYDYFTGYHPHLHIVCVVKNSYFNKKNLMSPEDLAALWRFATDRNIDASAQEIKRITFDEGNKIALNNLKGKTKRSIPAQVVAGYQNEVDISYINEDDPTVYNVLSEAYFGLQDYHYTGIFRIYHRLYAEGKLDEYMPVDDHEYVYIVSVRHVGHGRYEIIEAYDLRTNERAGPAERARLDLII